MGLGISLAGVVIVTTGGDVSTIAFSGLGIGCALAGAASYGLFSVMGKKHDYEPFTSMMFYYGSGFLYSLAVIPFFSGVPSLYWPQFGGLLWLGVFPCGLGYVFWFLALKHGNTATMSNIVFMTPFLSLIYIRMLVGEPIRMASLAGLVIIIGGILVQSRGRSRMTVANETVA